MDKIKEEFNIKDKDELEYVNSLNEAVLLHPPKNASLIIWLCFILLIALITWASIMPIDEVVKSKGKIVPSKNIQNMQSTEGGVLKSLKIKEGEIVSKGQVLVEIDDTVLSGELTDSTSQKESLILRLAEIESHLNNDTEFDIKKYQDFNEKFLLQSMQRFDLSLKEKESNLKRLDFIIEGKEQAYKDSKSNLNIIQNDYLSAKEEYKLNQKAFNEGVLAKVELLKSKHNLNLAKKELEHAKFNVPKQKAEVNEAMQNKTTYLRERNNKFAKEKNELTNKLNTISQKSKGLETRDDNFIIKASTAGVIKKIYRYTIGSTIKAGENILQIVPIDDKLIIEGKVRPKDIGFLKVGLKAKVKLTAYDYSTYGGLNGEIEYVSADTIEDKKGNTFFIIRVLTDTNFIMDKQNVKHTIIPGMQSEMDIVVEQTSILKYIFKKVIK